MKKVLYTLYVILVLLAVFIVIDIQYDQIGLALSALVTYTLTYIMVTDLRINKEKSAIVQIMRFITKRLTMSRKEAEKFIFTKLATWAILGIALTMLLELTWVSIVIAVISFIIAAIITFKQT